MNPEDLLLHLEFADLSTYKKVISLCEKAVKKGWIETRQKWLGIYYAKEIESGYSPKLSVQKVDPHIGYGVIVEENLPKFAYVGEYVGVVRKRKRFSDKHNGYCFDYAIGEGRKSPFVIDAERKGSITRFINHSDCPNLEPLSVYSGGLMHVIFLTAQPIPKGTQLCYDYGDDYWAKRPKPLPIN